MIGFAWLGYLLSLAILGYALAQALLLLPVPLAVLGFVALAIFCFGGD